MPVAHSGAGGDGVSAAKTPSSRARGADYLGAAFEAIKAAGGTLPLRRVKAEVASRVLLTQADKHVFQKSGYVRWESVLHFYSIDCVKAGLLTKDSGLWSLTEAGLQAATLPGGEIMAMAVAGYKAWVADGTKTSNVAVIEAETVSDETLEGSTPSYVFEQANGDARLEIEASLKSIDAYEFQRLVAGCLHGLGYATPFIAKPGPDGGTDILAYKDPLGVERPHIRVQVKHQMKSGQKATRQEIAQLRGILRQDREVGLFVSSTGFTSDALREGRQGNPHVEMMDLSTLLDLWIRNYERLTEDDRALLRLRPVHFLAPR